MKTPRIILTALTLLLTATLVACGNGSGLPGTDPLNGTSWSLSSIDGAAPLTGTAQTLTFADGKVSGSGGCNSYGGSYSLGGDGIRISEIVSTLMACVGPAGLMDQESAFLNSLMNARTYTLEGNSLQVRTSDGRILDFVPLQ